MKEMNKAGWIAAALAAMLAASGCVSHGPDYAVHSYEGETANRSTPERLYSYRNLNIHNSNNRQKPETALDVDRIDPPAPPSITKAKHVTTTVRPAKKPATKTPAAAVPTPQADELPPNAKAGECYARVFEPAQYDIVKERVIVQEASQKVDITPAIEEWVEKQVIVKEASKRLEVIPAQYETRTERVLVKPASTRIEQVPAEYKTVTEQVLVKQAQTVWKKGKGAVEKIDGATGEIMCLVEIPAEYKTVTRQVVVKPASTRTVKVEAEYESVPRTVMVTPPQTKEVVIPAEYRTIRVREITQPAKEVVTPVAPVYDMVEKKVLRTPARNAWRRVFCETNLTPERIGAIQAALIGKGYDPGVADGKLGEQTMAAIQAYQAANNLATGGITYQTVEHLGLQF